MTRMLLLPLMLAAATSIAQGDTGKCRIGVAAYASSTTGLGLKTTVTTECAFDDAGTKVTCTIHYRDNAGNSSVSTSATVFATPDDFVDEISVIPPLTKSLSSTATLQSNKATTSNSAVNSYDEQGRITQTRSSPGKPQASATTYLAWDRAGRPTVAKDVGQGFNNRRDISYDDRARTRTTRVNGGPLVTIETFDANGNLVRQVVKMGGTVTGTTTFTITPAEPVCR